MALAALLWGGIASAQTLKAPPLTQVTGQHRGFSNEKLFLRPDDGKELTFVVAIPGDANRQWQKDFAVLSRITVTYRAGAPGAPPIVTAIRRAVDTGKK